MTDEKPHQQPAEPAPTESDERLADLRRRRAEAADVLAETLLAIWLAERRARRTAGKGGRDV